MELLEFRWVLQNPKDSLAIQACIVVTLSAARMALVIKSAGSTALARTHSQPEHLSKSCAKYSKCCSNSNSEN